MFAKKPDSSSPSPSSNRGYRKELEYLRARKSTIDGLIQSLEDYGRFRSPRTDDRKRETA